MTVCRRILLVDDERDATTALAHVLEADGFETFIAHDGAAALDAVAHFEPHAALLDLRLPCMDGWQVARKLRERGHQTVLIAVTGYPEDAESLRNAGFDHLLTKPIDFQRLALLLTGDHDDI